MTTRRYNRRMTLTLIWIVLGWLVGYTANQLADYLPQARFAEHPVPFRFSRPGLLGLVDRGRIRPLLVELLCPILYGFLPALIEDRVVLAINSFHIAVLILIIVIDLEHRLIFDVVTYPATLLAFLGSFFLQMPENRWAISLAGAVVGFVIFWVLFKIAQLAYGEASGALGAGDVKLAMLMGAMLGLHRIPFALFFGVVLGGVVTLLLLLSGRVSRRTALPYGQYLAVAAIVMLIWGAEYVQNYLN